MSMPANLTVFDVPESLYDAIRARAARHGRSVQSEVRAALEEAFLTTKPRPRLEPVLTFVEAQRRRLAAGQLPRPPRPILLLLRGWRDESDARIIGGEP
jgi:plasmid stability protein